MKATTLKIDMDRDESRSRLWDSLKRWRGVVRVEICRWRDRRSDRQNRWYHPAFTEPLAAFLREQGQAATRHDAHQILKHKFLRRAWVDKKTGEELVYTKSTTELTTTEFNEYLDLCAAWLHDLFGFKFPEPSEYHEREEREAA